MCRNNYQDLITTHLKIKMRLGKKLNVKYLTDEVL